MDDMGLTTDPPAKAGWFDMENPMENPKNNMGLSENRVYSQL